MSTAFAHILPLQFLPSPHEQALKRQLIPLRRISYRTTLTHDDVRINHIRLSSFYNEATGQPRLTTMVQINHIRLSYSAHYKA